MPRSRSSFRFLLLTMCALALVVPAAGQFETRGTFLANHGPNSIAVGDFNHDGTLDLAIAAAATNTANVVILLGNGDGAFREGSSYTAGTGAVSIVAADFNHDGNLDLAVANSLSNYISILHGNGDGTFRAGPQNPAVPQAVNFVTVSDFNRDGAPDLVAFSYAYPHNLSIIFGNGDGTFQNAVVTDTSFDIQSLGVGDFNHDGKLDVVTAGNFTINVLLGNGDGTFQYGASYPSGESPASIAVADFNGDHKLDLAIASVSEISILLSNGDGTFQTAVNYPTNFPLTVTAAVLTGSRKVDLVVANSIFPSGVSVFAGNGDGSFQPGVFYPSNLLTTEYAAVGDFNGDRQADIVYANYEYESVTVLLNTGVVSYSPTTPLNFKKQAAGTTSPPLKVTLTNTGTTALRIASMKASAEFGVTSTCGSSVAAGAKCTISATFSPTKKGPVQGTISIIDSASTKPQVIELLGTGT